MKRLIPLLIALGVGLTAPAIKPAEMKAHDAAGLPVVGTLAPDASKAYSRLPDAMADTVRTELRDLGYNSAGLAIRFRSDAEAIGARWRSLKMFNMNHMTPTGIRGVDLYVMLDDSTWTSVGSGRPALREHTTSSLIMPDMPRRMREYMLYLPLYDGVDSVYILTDSAAVVEAPAIDLPRRDHPVVMYGTSILQGGCASRPGMVHTSIVGRMLNREVINLGFSGNARLDLPVADLMASADASVYVLDVLPNCTAEVLEERLEAFYRRLRSVRPTTPILFVESPMFPASRFSTEVVATLTHKNEVFRAIFDRLHAEDANIYYMPAEQGMTNPEGTVDNYHFTDLGFDEYARSTYRFVAPLIAD